MGSSNKIALQRVRFIATTVGDFFRSGIRNQVGRGIECFKAVATTLKRRY